MCGVFATTRSDLWDPLTLRLEDAIRLRATDRVVRWVGGDGRVLMVHACTSSTMCGAERSLAPARLDPWTSSDCGAGESAPNGPGSGNAPAQPTRATPQPILERVGFGRPQRVRGGFAFAHWDPHEQRLSAGRDLLGVQPLYVLDHPSGGVTVSSALRPLLLLPEARVVDPIGLAGYLAFGQSGPMLTAYLNVRKLAAGVVASWTLATSGATRLETTRVAPIELVAEGSVAARLEESTRALLTGTSNAGVLVDGGFASRVLAAMVAETDRSTPSYSLSWIDHGAPDESLEAHRARTLGLRHTSIAVTVKDLVAALDHSLRRTGELFDDVGSLSLATLSLRIGEGTRAMLTATGADEVLGTKAEYRWSRWLPVRPIAGVRKVGVRCAEWMNTTRDDGPLERRVEAALRAGGPRGYAALNGCELLPFERHSDVGVDLAVALRTDWYVHTDGVPRRAAGRAFDLAGVLPSGGLASTRIALAVGGVGLRTPFLDLGVVDAMGRGGAVARPEDCTADLRRRYPGVDAHSRGARPSLATKSVFDAGLRDDFERVVGSETSPVRRLYGDACANALRARAEHSEALAFRMAMLGRWEAVTDVVV